METTFMCDTFVVLPPHTKDGVVFGCNSHPPKGELQEVVYFPASECSDHVKCTYIEVESAGFTKAVILNKTNWMWGAEMGANECGVAIGSQPILTINTQGDHDPHVKRLLGMDLVRLGLERSSNAEEALDVMTQLLEKYGQGGSSSVHEDFCHHNSFLIADPTTAWVLETSGKHWVAHQVKSGFYNISTCISITTNIDKKSEGIEEYVKEQGLWNGEGQFNFCEIFRGDKETSNPTHSQGKELLEKLATTGNFREVNMFSILRNEESGICETRSFSTLIKGSQVSELSNSKPSIHWFTATPDPSMSVFKPFAFTPNVKISKHTVCPDDVSQPHTLYALHAEAIKKGTDVNNLLRNMEHECVLELEKLKDELKEDLSELDELMKDCVETEVKFYR
ncbi:hypothetical protein WA026_003370 [Henosepilachna vigintioctopunctata]|uniref:Secernin-3 n=1 Tax=Henosepilachna vigintioctopunctata TaxID=420089 RepID=A0AAW1THF3_9CUCU